MIDTRVCNDGQPSGCATAPATVTVGDKPDAVDLDSQAHTVYVANAGAGSSGTVSVINAATCNATDSAGCGTLATLHVPGGHPGGIAVNAATGTLYVATRTSSGPNLMDRYAPRPRPHFAESDTGLRCSPLGCRPQITCWRGIGGRGTGCVAMRRADSVLSAVQALG
jgi:DNA-binding beta-propeller fold protein YncE